MENIPAVKTDATEKPGSDSASATENKGITEPAKGTSSPDDKGSSQDADKGKENYVPKSRLDEVIGQRNIERQQREELERRVRELETVRRATETDGGTADIYTNPDEYVDKRVNPRMSTMEYKLDALESENMDKSMREDFNSNPVLQKLYGTYDELSYAIDTRAKEIGFTKRLSPRERRTVYSDLIDSRKGDIVNVAMELGREEEKKRREIIPTTSDVAGSNIVPVKGKEISLSKEEMNLMSKLGLTKEAYKEFMEKAEVNGQRTSRVHPDL